MSLRWLIRKSRGGQRTEEHKDKKKTLKKPSPPTSDYSGSIDSLRDPLPLLVAEGGTCHTGTKPFYDYSRLNDCYKGYLDIMDTILTMEDPSIRKNVNVAMMTLFTSEVPIYCNTLSATAVYADEDSGSQGSTHQIWSTVSLMLYDFGQCQYGLFALNMEHNYALRVDQDPSDKNKASVKFQRLDDIRQAQQFQMTGQFDKLQLSIKVGGETYFLYAAPAPKEGFGTLTAVSDGRLDTVLRSSGGTAQFKFQRPINMYSQCP